MNIVEYIEIFKWHLRASSHSQCLRNLKILRSPVRIGHAHLHHRPHSSEVHSLTCAHIGLSTQLHGQVLLECWNAPSFHTSVASLPRRRRKYITISRNSTRLCTRRVISARRRMRDLFSQIHMHSSVSCLCAQSVPEVLTFQRVLHAPHSYV